MKVESVKEHEDGSAVVVFNMTQHEVKILLNLGIVTAILNGIRTAEEYTPSD